MKYVYETHLHTVEASACSCTPGEDYITYMKNLGYSGIIVTDHFFNGNSCIPRNLPWEERVSMYARGYENALRKAGDDFTVLFGVEFNFEGDEFLLYGVDKEWLMDRPGLMEMGRQEVYREVHESGAIMIQAHPFRERGYLSAIHLTPGACDGIEAYNASNPDWQNALAYMYGKDRGFLMSAGSDIHNFTLDDMGGMSFDHPVNTIEEFVRAFMAGEGEPVYKKGVHDGKREFAPVCTDRDLTYTTGTSNLEVFWH